MWPDHVCSLHADGDIGFSKEYEVFILINKHVNLLHKLCTYLYVLYLLYIVRLKINLLHLKFIMLLIAHHLKNAADYDIIS